MTQTLLSNEYYEVYDRIPERLKEIKDQIERLHNINLKYWASGSEELKKDKAGPAIRRLKYVDEKLSKIEALLDITMG